MIKKEELLKYDFNTPIPINSMSHVDIHTPLDTFLNRTSIFYQNNICKDLHEWLKSRVRYFDSIQEVASNISFYKNKYVVDFVIRFDIKFPKIENSCHCTIYLRNDHDYYRILFWNEHGEYKDKINSEIDLFNKINELSEIYFECLM